jgi:hypothetical protein
MDADVVAGRGLAQDMGTFEMHKRRRGGPAILGPAILGKDGCGNLPLDGW